MRSEEYFCDGGVKIVMLWCGDDVMDVMSRGEEEGVDDVDDVDDEAFARWMEVCGYEDMRDEFFDLYVELKILKENVNLVGCVWVVYYCEVMKWYFDRLLTNGGVAGFCDVC